MTREAELPGTYRVADGARVQFTDALAAWIRFAQNELVESAWGAVPDCSRARAGRGLGLADGRPAAVVRVQAKPGRVGLGTAETVPGRADHPAQDPAPRMQ
jgi:hypothetical protein